MQIDEEILIDEMPDDQPEVDYNSISVQVLYRPVLQLKTLPDAPPLDPNHEDFIWWQEQINRCQFGWIAPDYHYINGYLYFYLNFVKIHSMDPNTKIWKWSSPLYRDNDEDIFNILWANTARRLPNGDVSNARNLIGAKPRGIGWTLLTLQGVGLYNFVFKPENPVGCAYPNEDTQTKERMAFQTSWDKLHPIFKRHKGVELIPLNNSNDEFVVGEKIKGEKIVKRHAICRFDVVASDSAGVYKGDRMSLMIAVEAGLWKGNSLKNYVSENEPSVKLGTNQWGMIIIGGTSNAIINKSSAYKEMYYNPKPYNAVTHFTPGTKVLSGFIDYHTGKSDEEGALKLVLSRREGKIEDPDAYQQELVENPITPAEAFIPNLQLAYSSAVINEQIMWVKSNYADTQWKTGRLEYIMDANGKSTGKVKFIEDGSGDWYINMEGLPRPMYGNLHIAAIDDRYKSRNANAKVDKRWSKNAMIIWRQPTVYPVNKTDMPCGLYHGNHPDMTVAYEEFLKGMLFWDVRQTLYEYNAEAFPNFLRTKNEISRLYYINDMPGIKVSGKEKTELTFLGSQFFAAGRHKNITCLPILESFLVWGGTENTDIGSCVHLIFLLLKLTEETEVTIINQEKLNHGAYIILGRQSDAGVYEMDTSQIIMLGRRVA